MLHLRVKEIHTLQDECILSFSVGLWPLISLSRIKIFKGLAILNLDMKRFHQNNFTCKESLNQLGINNISSWFNCDA